MGKQEIIQVLLVDGSVVVVFLDEEATASNLIQSVVNEISLDNNKIDNYYGWIGILLSPDSHNKYQEVLDDNIENDSNNVRETRILGENEKVFDKINVGLDDEKIKSSKLTTDIHEFSQHLHQVCFKVVNSYDQITFILKDVKGFSDGVSKSIYISPSYSVKELIDIISDGLGLNNKLEDAKKGAPNSQLYILSIVKIDVDGSISTLNLSYDLNVLEIFLDFKNKTLIKEIKKFELVFSINEGWYKKMGTLTSRLTMNLSRPLSVLSFIGEGMSKTSYSSPNAKINSKTTSPLKPIRHLSLSATESEFEVDPSRITTWISSEAGKPRRQTLLDPVFDSEWSATYPIFKKLRHRERLSSMNEEEKDSNLVDDFIDPDKLEEELTELDQAFNRVLDDLNIKDGVRAKMLQFPPSKKIELIEQNEAVQRAKNSATPLFPSATETNTDRPRSTVSSAILPPVEDSARSAAQASLEHLLSSDKAPPKNPTTLTGYLFGNLFSGYSINHPEGSVEYYLAQLNSRNLQAQDIFKCLQSLRITLSSASVTWIRNFLECGSAIQSLEFLLEKFISKNDSIVNDDISGAKVHDIDEEVQLECIRCFRILLNTEPGFHEVLKHPSLIQSLTYSINTTNDKIRNIVAEVLAAICVLSIDGHNQVLDALSDFRLKFHEEYRFQYILDSLHTPVSTEGISAIAAYEYKTTCLSFINALVNSPESLDERMLLREEFRRRGLLHIFQDLRESYPPESLSKQIECYEEETSADISELKDNVMFETLEAENTNLIDFAENMRQMDKESVLNNVVNEIIASLNDLLSYEIDDEVRYEIMNTTSRFFIQAMKFKDTEDWSLVLASFFTEVKDLIALDIREFFESQPQFKSELQKLEEFKSHCTILQEQLELSQKELSDIKTTPMISYILNQEVNDTDDFNLIKSPKDNFTTLIQRLVLKEKEISSLREKIEILENLKVSEGSESKVLENSWSAIKEELDAKKQENIELSSAVETRGKEIAYLKRSLEAVCTRFQLAVKEFSPDENIDLLSNNMAIDSSAIISLPEVQKIQQELEKTQHALENKEDLESELTSFKNKVSMLNLQIQEQNIKLAEKDSELQSLQKRIDNTVVHAPSHSSFSQTRIADNLNATKTSHTPSKSLSFIPPTSLIDSSSLNKSHEEEEATCVLITKDASDNEKNKIPTILSSQSVPPPPPPPRLSTPLVVTPLSPPPPPLPSNSPKKSWIVSGPPMPPPPPPPIYGSATIKGSNLLDPNSSQCILAGPSLIGESITSISDILKPKVPMKSFFWKKIPASKIPTTFWSHPQEEDILSKLNLEDIEALFQKKLAKKPGSGYTSIGRKIKEKKNIILIEFNRANNIAITLARMKMPFSAIKLAILEVNDSRLSIDNLRSLENHAPTQEEVNLVRTFKGSFDNLGTAEKYILQIMDIPRLSERLNCMIFRRRFENDVEEIRPELNILNKAVIELKSSKRLVLLLEIILTVGNFLNANTPRGDAKGFKLEALKQLKDLKTNAKGHNLPIISLLHYFAWISEESWENLTDLKKDFPSIESAARISVTTLTNNVYSLVQGVKQIQFELRAHKKLVSPPENDKFIGTMENFVNIASKVTASIKESSDKLENNLEELLTYFGEDSTITKPEDFFNLIISFLDALEIARVENNKLKEKAIQKTINISKISANPVPGFGRGDFDVAVRELRSGLRRKRTERERPRSQLFSNISSLPVSSLDSSPKP